MSESYLDQFIRQHGGTPVQAAPESAEYLLPDGARFSGIEWITYIDPPLPLDGLQNLRARVRYAETAVAVAVAGFERQKSEFDQQDYFHLYNPSTCPPSPPFAAEHLRLWAVKIERLRGSLAEVTEQLNKTRQVQTDRAAEDARRAAMQGVRDRMTERAAIKV